MMGIRSSRRSGFPMRPAVVVCLLACSLVTWLLPGPRSGFGQTGKTEALSFEQYLELANRGDAKAQFAVGSFFLRGKKYPKTTKRLLNGSERQLSKECPKHRPALAPCYLLGRGLAKDHQEAVKWFLLAAEQGESGAQYNLGSMYLHGQGVPKDDAEAMKWFRKSAEQGYVLSQFNLAGGYAEGRGVQQDFEEAAKWCRKAAEQGDTSAQFQLGLMYEAGRGVNRDRQEAVKWLTEAAQKGSEPAKAQLHKMGAELTK